MPIRARPESKETQALMTTPPKQLEFHHYRIITEVGAGGLGQVFKAVDERNGRVVAVKVLHQRYQTSRRFLGIFHRELLIISRLKHKHIVEYIEANFSPPNCYIVTEFVDGWSLHWLMKRFGKIPPLVALSIAIDILQGIDYLHLQDIIHSDLSAPNVLIDKTGRVLVTDFGLAAADQTEDYRNYMIGTPGYYSPEHVTDAAIVSQSDLYCVGLLIYQMIVGDKAVPATRDRKEIYRNMKRVNFKRVETGDRKLTKMIRRLLKIVLRMGPSRRFPNAETMIFEIYKILRAYNIRYARYGIHQFLLDKKLTQPLQRKVLQDIYFGTEPAEASSVTPKSSTRSVVTGKEDESDDD